MSAGFKFAGHVHWGTNGAIEAYLETLCQVAAERLGAESRLAAALREWRDVFSMGTVIYLDHILTEPGDRDLFDRFLGEATDRLLQKQVFSEYGREWVATEIRALRDRLAAADQSAADAFYEPAEVKPPLTDKSPE